jgi:hypothetical protein
MKDLLERVKLLIESASDWTLNAEGALDDLIGELRDTEGVDSEVESEVEELFDTVAMMASDLQDIVSQVEDLIKKI